VVRKILIGVAVVFIILIIFGGFIYNETYYEHYPKVRSGIARRADFSSTVSASGQIEFKDKRLIKARVGGQVGEVKAEEGGRVEKGQVILQLDTLRKNLEIKQAEIAFLEAEKRHRSLMIDFKRELAALLKTTAERVRVDLDIGRLDRNRIPKDLLISYEGLQRLRMNLSLLRQELNDMSVRSPISGTVIKASVKEGDSVSAGAALFEIADLREVEVVSYFDAKDARSIDLGQGATVTGSALSDEEYEGRVAYVGPVVEEVNGLRSVKVVVDFLEYNSAFRPGLPVEVTVSTGIKDLTLTVPVEAVYRLPPDRRDNPEFHLARNGDRDMEEYVFILERPEKILTDLDEKDQERYIRDKVYIVRGVRVRTGDTNRSEVEIKDNLEDGSPTRLQHFDKVVVFSDRPLRDYDKVILLDRDERIFTP
jgi:RND family efflux transporter MFP subunit